MTQKSWTSNHQTCPKTAILTRFEEFSHGFVSRNLQKSTKMTQKSWASTHQTCPKTAILTRFRRVLSLFQATIFGSLFELLTFDRDVFPLQNIFYSHFTCFVYFVILFPCRFLSYKVVRDVVRFAFLAIISSVREVYFLTRTKNP